MAWFLVTGGIDPVPEFGVEGDVEKGGKSVVDVV